jgi:hypothetical protein
MEEIEILDTIPIFEEDHHPLVASAYDMVKSTFELDP